MNYLEGLNPTQLRAVQHKQGPALVDAGPGSGKTKTISTRIKHLLENKVPSGQILAVSFTQKSTLELAERVKKLTDSKINISTFHKWAYSSLRDAGIKFAILNPNEQEDFFRSKIPDEKLCRRIMTTIDKAKNNLFLSPESWSKSRFAETFTEENKEEVKKVWKDYQNFCQRTNQMDFTDLLTLFYSKWKKEMQAGGGKIFQTTKRFNHLMIDEFQDTNPLQLKLVKLWAGRPEESQWKVNGYPSSLLVCGDPDQAIYGFRGGEPKIFIDFPQTFAGTEVFNLGENYRSQEKIVRHAISVISNNLERSEKAIKPMRSEGETPTIFVANSTSDEVEWVTKKIESLKESGISEIAILSRHNEPLNAFRKKLEGKGFATREENFTKLPEVEVVRNLLKLGLEIDQAVVEKAVPKKHEANLRKSYSVAKKYDIYLFEALASDAEMSNWLTSVRRISSAINSRKYSEALMEALTATGLMQTAFAKAGQDVMFFRRLQTISNLVEKSKSINLTNPALGVKALLEFFDEEKSVT